MKVYLFACIEKNIGDDLFVKILCERYPNTDFIITSNAKYGTLAKIPNLKFSKKLKKWNWACSLEPKSRVKEIIARILEKYYALFLPKYNLGVSIVGNAFKNNEYTGWKQSHWIREKIKFVDKFYIISTNFGPYNNECWKKDFNKIFSKMADVCFRDEYSYNLFSQLPNVRYAPDAVMTLGHREHNMNNNVIISLIDCSLEGRSEKLKKATEIYELRMVETIKLLNKNGYKVTLLNSNTEQDRPCCNRILSSIDENIKINVVDYNGDLNEIFELYNNSSYVIGTRLHTIVLAWIYKTPVVPIVYDIKVSNLLKTCIFDKIKFDITNLKAITATDIVNAMKNNNFIWSQ